MRAGPRIYIGRIGYQAKGFINSSFPTPRHTLSLPFLHLLGRWAASRPVTNAELTSTTLLKIPIQSASCKIRTGPPKDDKKDEENEELCERLWTGVVELPTTFMKMERGSAGKAEGKEIESLIGINR